MTAVAGQAEFFAVVGDELDGINFAGEVLDLATDAAMAQGLDLVHEPRLVLEVIVTEHIALSEVPHTKWLLVRGEAPASRKLVKQVKTRLKPRG